MAVNKNTLFSNLTLTILYIAILIVLLIEIILNLTPPIDRDALIHHLAIPKLWLRNGGFYEIKWAVFSYYPMNIDLLYLIPLYFNKDFAAKFIHMGFGFGTAFLVYLYLKIKMSRIAGLLGSLVFLSTPMVVRTSTEAYVDLGLVFYLTAAILSFTHYRDGWYKEIKWLFLSGFAMGLALGSKYNALIAWFFLSMAVVFVYSRDTKDQWKAIKCGAVFFLVSLLTFSPWLIKNFVLTGNPLYPLLQGIFNVSNLQTQEGAYSMVAGTASGGIFQVREMMFGESIWDTLLIPIRYFFQGQDHNIRYFDGVLNPFLIIFSPFAFVNKSFRRDKLFFTGFAVFFILTATFLDQTRTRYILPAIPVLAILSTAGFINIWNQMAGLPFRTRVVLAVALITCFTVLMSQNALYIKIYYQQIGPAAYLSGRESRDDFISRHDCSYPAMQYINKTRQDDAKVRLIFLAGRGYYLDRTYEDDPTMGMAFINGLITASKDEKYFHNYLHSLGYSHLLVRNSLFHKFLQDNYSPDTVKLFMQRLGKEMVVVYSDNGYAVYQIIPAT